MSFQERFFAKLGGSREEFERRQYLAYHYWTVGFIATCRREGEEKTREAMISLFKEKCEK